MNSVDIMPAASAVTPVARLASVLERHGRERFEQFVELAIDFLDATDPDPDLEDGDVDRCDAGDDAIEAHRSFGPGDGYPGDLDDAEEEDDYGVEDTGEGVERSVPAKYGVDQSLGPIPPSNGEFRDRRAAQLGMIQINGRWRWPSEVVDAQRERLSLRFPVSKS